MKTPLVSVVIPTFNAERTVGDALASVRAQTFTDYEIIVVDDASTDNTLEIASERLRQTECPASPHPRIPQSSNERIPELSNQQIDESTNHQVIALPRNRGPAATRNAGIEVARGEWIAFLDGDDTWLPWRLDAQMKALKGVEGVGLLCGRTAEMKDDVAAPRAVAVPVRQLSLSDFAVRNEVATSTVLARRREVVQAGMFDEQFRGPEDYDLWMRVAARTTVLKLETPLARYREVRGSLSRDDRTFLPEVLRVLDKAYGPGGALESIPARRQAFAYQYLCAAWMAAERGARARTYHLFLASFARWPFSFRPYLNAPWCRTKLLAGILRRSRRIES